MRPLYRRIAVSVAIGVVILASLLGGVLVQALTQAPGQSGPLAPANQVYLPMNLKGYVPPTSPTPYGGALLLPPALRAEQPFQVASLAGRLFAVIAGGGLLLAGIVVTWQRSHSR